MTENAENIDDNLIPEGYRHHFTIQNGAEWPMGQDKEAYLSRLRSLYGPILAIITDKTHTSYYIPEKQ